MNEPPRVPRAGRHFLDWSGTDLAECTIAHLSREELELTRRVFPAHAKRVFAILGETAPALGAAPADAEIARWFLSACLTAGAS